MESSQETVDNHMISTIEKSEEKDMPVPPPPPPVEEGNAEVVIVKMSGKKSKRVTKKSAHNSDGTSASDPDDSDSNSESEDSSADEKAKRKKKRKLAAKRAAAKKKQKAKAKAKKSKSKKYESTSEDQNSSESSDSDEDSELEGKKSRRKALRAKAKKKRSKQLDISSDESDSDSSSSLSSSSSPSSSDTDFEDEKSKRRRAKAKAKAKRKNKKSKKVNVVSSSDSSSDGEDAFLVPTGPPEPPLPTDDLDTHVEKVGNILADLKLKQSIANNAISAAALDKPVKKNALEYKRVDQVYDMSIHDWKLVESNKEQKDEFDCVFTVRRRLDWEGKYRETAVDIKSKLLRNALQEIFKDCKSISLVEDTPQIDPNTLFHYYDELKAYVKKILKPKYKKAKKSKEKKRLHQQVLQCRLLLSYIDEDYTATRKALKPMLKAGTITYDLVWALFKPNTIAFTPTYHNKDDPRCFKVDTAYEYESWMTGIKSWYVDGRYLEYDGKSFGLGDHQIAIQAFKGHKKITSLAAYPLKFHKDPEVSEGSD
jgi:hypothetical protein